MERGIASLLLTCATHVMCTLPLTPFNSAEGTGANLYTYTSKNSPFSFTVSKAGANSGPAVFDTTGQRLIFKVCFAGLKMAHESHWPFSAIPGNNAPGNAQSTGKAALLLLASRGCISPLP